MSHFRFARISLILAAIGLNAAPAILGTAAAYAADPAPAAAPPADTVRPEIYKLIDPAVVNELVAAKNYAEVQKRIDQAEAIADKTVYENFILNRMRYAIASGSGNNAMAATTLSALIDSGKLTPKDKVDFIQALGNLYYNGKDYPKAIEAFTRYGVESGDTAKQRPYIIRAYYFSNDFATAKTELNKDLEAHHKAGTKPAMEELQMLVNISAKTKDTAGYLIAMEQLVKYYPSDAYWNDLVRRTQGKSSFNALRLRLDALRLQRTVVAQLEGDDYADLAELAMLGGFSAEAKNALDKGFELGLLGTGPDAAKHKKLREQANKGAADDTKNIGAGEAAAMKSKGGVGLVNLGYTYVTMDQFDKGIDLMQKGIARGVAKNPEDAKLRLGYAYALAGRKDDAIKTLETIQGADGSGDLARFWILWLNRPATVAK
ncbi:tetratricopeptide repeat protein [Oxalobacteraceae bacterium]|nr:tetratricopeptide repeat protein [Oxalobacteraceae bacterium]